MKILVVGPSTTKSKGGMATVISEIGDDKELNKKYDIELFESFVDGGKIKRFIYTSVAYLNFYFTKRNYDIYHIHAASRGSTFRKGYYVRAAKKWGKKVILHIHGAQYMEFYNEVSDRKRKKIINILKSADMVLALSKDWKSKFDQTFGLNNCYVLENGIDTVKLKEAIIEPSLHRNCFLFLGRLGERKGAYDLINAMEIAVQQNPEIKLFMAGDGEIEKVKKIVVEKGLNNNIDVIGWVDLRKKIELLKKVSTLVLPSYNEGLPMSILEGMACGKAIISTNVGAIPEVVCPNNGILIKPRDINGLSEAMIRISNNLNMIEEFSTNNIFKINNSYSMKAMHRKLEEFYDNI